MTFEPKFNEVTELGNGWLEVYTRNFDDCTYFKTVINVDKIVQLSQDKHGAHTIVLEGKTFAPRITEDASANIKAIIFGSKEVSSSLKTQEVTDRTRKATRAEEAWRESVDRKLSEIHNKLWARKTSGLAGPAEHTVDAQLKDLKQQLAEALARIEALEANAGSNLSQELKDKITKVLSGPHPCSVEAWKRKD